MVPFRADSRGPNPTANLVSDREKENMCINTRSILVFFCVLKRKFTSDIRFNWGNYHE